jgi:hypothetical protein
MQPVVALRLLALAAVALGCGEDPARVQLVPVDIGGECGRPSNANQLAITAFAETGEVKRAIALDRGIEIADFPADTTQLGVEILVGGGATGAAGKTLPLAFDELADDATIPVLMAPPDGFCPVGKLIDARQHPLIARAGTGVLVAGGVGPAGPLSTAEVFDPSTATWTAVEVPEALRDDTNGLAGAVLTTLADGRVVLTGGPRGLLAVFDPETKAFGSTFAISPQRAFHGAAATPNGVLLVGGCQGVDGGTCNATPLRSSVEYRLDGTSIVTGPTLAGTAVAEGAELFDTGGVFVLAGGFGTPGEAHRFTLEDRDATGLVGVGAQPTMLDGGGVLTAFAPDAAPPLSTAAVVTPSGAVVPVTPAPPLAGARLITLEDGRVVGFGGDTGVDALGAARVLDHDPTSGAWALRAPTASPSQVAPEGRPGDQPPVLVAPSAIRLADGSVLVLGGEPAPSTNAWVYRPSLVGASSGSVTASPSVLAIAGVLTPSDPATLARTDGNWILTAGDELGARALVGGPRFARGSIRATVNVLAGGVALIAQQTSPDRAIVAHLIPGEPARIEQLGDGTLCSGPIVEPFQNPLVATLEIGDGLTLRIGEAVILACDQRAVAVGAWGVAADRAESQVNVATVTVAR